MAVDAPPVPSEAGAPESTTLAGETPLGGLRAGEPSGPLESSPTLDAIPLAPPAKAPLPDLREARHSEKKKADAKKAKKAEGKRKKAIQAGKDVLKTLKAEKSAMKAQMTAIQQQRAMQNALMTSRHYSDALAPDGAPMPPPSVPSVPLSLVGSSRFSPRGSSPLSLGGSSNLSHGGLSINTGCGPNPEPPLGGICLERPASPCPPVLPLFSSAHVPPIDNTPSDELLMSMLRVLQSRSVSSEGRPMTQAAVRTASPPAVALDLSMKSKGHARTTEKDDLPPFKIPRLSRGSALSSCDRESILKPRERERRAFYSPTSPPVPMALWDPIPAPAPSLPQIDLLDSDVSDGSTFN
jgi:hypothetical protein